MKIVVIDYGLGNLQSVAGAIEKLGHVAIISSDIREMKSADKLILPGVGAFRDGMNNINGLGLFEPLTDLVVNHKKPILGICLGCQLMGLESFEFGHYKGLGWINASVKKLEPNDPHLRIPHIGWNNLIQRKHDVLFDAVPEDALFYYTHTYCLVSNDVNEILGECDYGGNFVAVVHKDNIYGTQFHPEKSQLHGLQILKNFIEKC